MHWSYGCMAEPGDRNICREYRRIMEVAMDRMPWEDWWAQVVELAEEDGIRPGPPSWFRERWAAGVSPEKALEEKEEE